MAAAPGAARLSFSARSSAVIGGRFGRSWAPAVDEASTTEMTKPASAAGNRGGLMGTSVNRSDMSLVCAPRKHRASDIVRHPPAVAECRSARLAFLAPELDT